MTASPRKSIVQASVPPRAAPDSATAESARDAAAVTWHMRRAIDAVGAHNIGLVVGLLALITYFGSQNSGFFLPANAVNIAQAAAVLGIVTIAQTVVVISAGLDISVGSTAGVCSVVTALAINHVGATSWTGAVIGVVAALGVGLVAGLVNGLVIVATGISPVIVTLGTYTLYQGVAYLLCGGVGIPIPNPHFDRLGFGTVGGIPYPVFVLVGVAIVFGFCLRFTDIGRNTFAIGGNVVAARLAGIRVDRYKVAIYGVTGMIAGLAGAVLAAQVSSGQPAGGSQNLALTSIAAVLLGGTALSGGRGSIFGTVLGVLLLGTLDNGLLVLSVSEYWQQVAQGAVLVVVVALQVKPWSAAARSARRGA
jgi:ribose transport system permease protein